MKLTLFIFFLAVFEVLASPTYSQETMLSFKMNDTSIKEVLLEIENTSEFFFLYNNELVDVERKVDIDINDKPIVNALNQIFEGQEVQFSVMDRQIIISPQNINTNSVQDMSKILTGMVHDELGNSLPGVSVIIKGTTKGTITDIDGNYSIAIEKDELVLLYSFIGMETQEIAVGDKEVINVTMRADAIGLDEVVAIGYGVRKKSSITGSISSISKKELTKVPATNTASMLAGRLPGAIVTNNSGQPGNDESKISIRGFGDALVIVDGVPRDFQQLDPNEIESVSILKDASAAVYGARAGNGVILVTTKKGSRNTKPSINYTGNVSLQRPTFMHEMADAVGYASYFQQAERLAGVTTDNLTYSDEDIEKYRMGTEPGYRGADWQDEVFKDWAPMQQHNINVSGGTDKVNYFVSLGSLNQESLLESGAGKYKRYNISSNVDVNITEKLKAGLNIKWRQEDRDDPNSLAGDNNNYERIFRYIFQAKPTVEPIPDEPDKMAYVTEAYQNPVAYSRQDIAGFSKDKRRQTDIVFSMDYELPVNGLSAHGKFSLKNYNRLNRSVEKPYSVYQHNYETGENTSVASLEQNRVSVSNWEDTQTTTQLSLTYDKTIEDHNFSALVLAEYFYADNYEFGSSRTDLASTEIPYLYAGMGSQTNYDDPSENGRKSFVGRFNYNYKEKYLIEFLMRADASIQFPTDSRWGYFPGVSLGWRMSEESFLQDSKSLDYLKLRASFASLGYDNISKFDYLSGYELRKESEYQYGFGSQMNLSTLQSVGLANPIITWESMDIYNVGVDATFWNGLLGIELDAFYRLRTGLLQDRETTVPTTFGAELPKENIGKRDNRGFELVLNHNNKIGDLSYQLSGNLTWTREKYVHEEEREFDSSDPDDARLNKKTGEWVNRTFGYKTDGFYDTQQEIDDDNLEYPELGEARLGDIKYVDRNGDNIIDYRDQEVLGKGKTPELYFGFNASVQYKNFDFSMLWQGAANYDIMMGTGYEVSPNLSISQIPFSNHVKYAWNAENPSAARLPAPSLDGLNTHNSEPSDIYLRKGGYVRLKTINLGYTLPKSLTDKVKLKKVRLFAAGYNLFTLMPNDIFDFDPESKAGDSGSTYPVQKVITFGVNVGL